MVQSESLRPHNIQSESSRKNLSPSDPPPRISQPQDPWNDLTSLTQMPTDCLLSYKVSLRNSYDGVLTTNNNPTRAQHGSLSNPRLSYNVSPLPQVCAQLA